MSRSRRSKSQVSAAAEGISVLDKLILAQSVWEVGPASWLKISRMMAKHPLLTHPKTFFTAQSCHAMYNHMMKESGFELSDANNAVHAPTHYKLAERYFAQRVEELRTLISAEEDQFKAISAEIEQIRAGQRDEEIEGRITGVPVPPADTEELPPAEEPEPSAPEPDVSTDVPTDQPADEPPEVEITASEPEAPEEPEEAVAVETAPPPPSPLAAAVIEEVEAQSEPAENSPAQEEAPSPIEENLDDLMQASDDETPEKAPEAEAPETVVDELPTVDASETPLDQTAPEPETISMDTDEQPAEAIKVEPDIQSKPVSQASAPSSVPENDPAEGSTTTRRTTRRRLSVSTAPPLPKKRGRRPLQKSPQAEPEPEVGAEADQEAVTPAPTIKESTPAFDDIPLDEEMPSPSPAAFRRRESKRKGSVLGSVDSPRPIKRSREDSEPVDDEDQGPGIRRRNTGRTEEQVALKRFQTVITMVHNQISQHRNGNIFHNPIKPSEAPDYHDIVKRPIDLKTIKAKIKDGVIGSSLEYQRDIYLMFANAMMYNRPGSDVHVMAEDMMVESEGYISTFRQTEGYSRRK